ncbi:hypothetical protein VTK73DRAFT_7239 [Phialemonium thermophilum]|uniref:MMS19 nucleotide excision repair protein n=1 Tax=Phialemonium thermophilum TaxID=223376 RepID=A0ABR3XTS8_9PEZI
MAGFQDLALQYVLNDNEVALQDIAAQAAREIEKSHASSAVVGNWASSIHQWMRGAGSNSNDGRVATNEDNAATDGDIIARAKALGFLASTLKALDRGTLKRDQIQRLIVFFGSIFSLDHKAGITASTIALRQLASAKHFRPEMGVKIIEDVCKIQEDFRLQTAATRLEVYELFLRLLQDPAVAAELCNKYGSSYAFVTDLLQLCQLERDPKNLMIWFKILSLLLKDYSPSADIVSEIFKTFSAYFPISLRSSTQSIGVTAEDLKGALRECFASNEHLAPHAFPFLLQKLDQGDAVSVAVKVDILKTMEICIKSYKNPRESVAPYVDKIWNSLKYEVRNGEVKEAIDSTLSVLRAIANRLDRETELERDSELLKNYTDLVFADCHHDLSDPRYTKQAGILLITAAASNIRGLVLETQRVIESVNQNLHHPKSPAHTRDLLALLSTLLRARASLVEDLEKLRPVEIELLKREPREKLQSLFEKVYLPIWRDASVSRPAEEQVPVLKEAIKGMGLLCTQLTVLPDRRTTLLNSGAVCSEICTLFIHRILSSLTLSSKDNITWPTELEDEVVLSFRAIVMRYADGLLSLVDNFTATVRSRDWRSPSAQSLISLKGTITRLAFIGCSEIPYDVAPDGVLVHNYSPLNHLLTITGALLRLVDSLLETRSSPTAIALVVSGSHAAALHFSDASFPSPKEGVSLDRTGSETDWVVEFLRAGTGARISSDWTQIISSHYGRSIEQSVLDASQSTSLPNNTDSVLQKHTRLSLFTLQHLYRRFTRDPAVSDDGGLTPFISLEVENYLKQGLSPDPFLYQLAKMASYVVQRLDATSQKAFDLAFEAFRFFWKAEPRLLRWDDGDGSNLNVLTRGLIEALWPDAMAELYKPDGIAHAIMCNTSNSATQNQRLCQTRCRIVTVLANKYKGGPTTSDPERLCFPNVVKFWKSRFNSAITSGSFYQEISFNLYVSQVLPVLAGAFARQDQEALEFVPLLHEAIGADETEDRRWARSIGLLVEEKDFLTREMHAVVRPLCRQWIYAALVKPLYALSLPSASDKEASSPRRAENYTIAIPTFLRHCPFTVYADDVAPLIRLLLTVLSEDFPRPSRCDLHAALFVLRTVLRNEPDALRGHLAAVTSATLKVYNSMLTVTDATSQQDVSPAVCRKLVLELLGELPQKFEERYLLPFSRQMRRRLATASGDPVREVRTTAIRARESWAKLA